MTNLNNAAQPVLTDEDIETLRHDWDCFFRRSTEGGAAICIRDIECRVLSNLRAPVADKLVDTLARYAYYYAVDLDRHTRNADLDQLEGISRRATAKLKVEIRAALASTPVAGEAVAEVQIDPHSPPDDERAIIVPLVDFEAVDAGTKLYASPQASETEGRRVTCQHHWVSGENQYVSGEVYVCTACRTIRMGPLDSETGAAALSTAVDYRRMEDTQVGASEHLARLAAALGNRDWKWWDSCSFRRLTFADGPDRRDGGALCGWVQPSDGHPDVSMAPGVREFIEAASPKAIAALAAAYMAALPAQPEQS